jgi:hypothetical protein
MNCKLKQCHNRLFYEDGQFALVAACAAGGIGHGMIVERHPLYKKKTMNCKLKQCHNRLFYEDGQFALVAACAAGGIRQA